jgi:hypothetical protein
VRKLRATSQNRVCGFHSIGNPSIFACRAAHRVGGQGKGEAKLSNELKTHLAELGRSKPYRDMPDAFSELAAVLIRSAEQERKGLERVIERMLQTVQMIPLDADVFYSVRTLQVEHGMSAQDSIVLASIVGHLSDTQPVESCFLNRNTKDFDDPKVRERLDFFGCNFFGRFDEGLRYIETHLARE